MKNENQITDLKDQSEAQVIEKTLHNSNASGAKVSVKVLTFKY